MGRQAEGRGQVTHHVGWGSGFLPGTASMAGYLHSHLVPTSQSPLPFRRDCSYPESEGGEAARESPLSPQLEEQAVGVGGEVVAGRGGGMRIVEGKKSALDGDRKEELGTGWEGRGGYQKGVFLLFFSFLWLGEEKKIKIPIPSQHKSMFAPSQHHGGGWARQI